MKNSTDFNEIDHKNFYNFVLTQKNFLKELSIVGVSMDSQFIKEILSFEMLSKIEFEIDVIEVNQSIMKSQHWRILRVKNPKLTHKKFILNATKNFPSK